MLTAQKMYSSMTDRFVTFVTFFMPLVKIVGRKKTTNQHYRIYHDTNISSTYRDSAVHQFLLDMTGLTLRALHMIIHGFVFEIYKTGS